MQSTSNNSQVLLTRSINLDCDVDLHVGSTSKFATFDIIEERFTHPTSKNIPIGRRLVTYTDSLQMFSEGGTASTEEHISISTDNDSPHFKDIADNEPINAEAHTSDSRETDDNDLCGDGNDARDNSDETRQTSETNGCNMFHYEEDIIKQSSPPQTSSSSPLSSSSSDNAVTTSKNNDESKQDVLEGCAFKTVLDLNNSQETTFFDDDDGSTEMRSADEKAFKLLKTLHFKSVATWTDDVTLGLKDEGWLTFSLSVMPS